MISSMTAFAKKESIYKWGRIYWEIRSLNQRYLDINIDLPKNFSDLSLIIRKKIKNFLLRGKIECSCQLDIENFQFDNIIINNKLVAFLIDSAQKISSHINVDKIDPVRILCYPGVISHTKINKYDDINHELLISFEETLTQLINNRRKEGFFLKKEITDRLSNISNIINSIQQYIPGVLSQKRKKFLEQVNNFSINLDSSRLEQELLIIIQKFDISEEIDRLVIHIRNMYDFLDKEGSHGRQLDFIAQELQRESNTLTAKSIDAHVINLAISLKVLIEQIREQIQNIE